MTLVDGKVQLSGTGTYDDFMFTFTALSGDNFKHIVAGQTIIINSSRVEVLGKNSDTELYLTLIDGAGDYSFTAESPKNVSALSGLTARAGNTGTNSEIWIEMPYPENRFSIGEQILQSFVTARSMYIRDIVSGASGAIEICESLSDSIDFWDHRTNETGVVNDLGGGNFEFLGDFIPTSPSFKEVVWRVGSYNGTASLPFASAGPAGPAPWTGRTELRTSASTIYSTSVIVYLIDIIKSRRTPEHARAGSR